MSTLLREDQAIIHAAVAGVNAPEELSGWSSLEWGDVEANNVKVYPGGMFPQVDLGGVPTRADATVTRPLSDAVYPYITQWENVCGSANGSISYTPKDANGNPNGPTRTVTGKLRKVTNPKYDAQGNAGAYVALVFSLDVKASQATG